MPAPKCPELTPAQLQDVVLRIFEIYDGRDVGASAHGAVIDILTDAGFDIRDPFEGEGQ